MSDNTYNGWTNWETWQILLWADNEPYLNELVIEFCQENNGVENFDYRCQRFFLSMFPDGTPDMKDVTEMDDVNWKEIAQHLQHDYA
jgi:hypothetical protein